MAASFDMAVRDIIRAGKRLDSLRLAPATSGNYSMRLDDGSMAITVSGAHKGQLEPHQIMRATLESKPLDDKKPSAETLLHCGIYKTFPHVNAILHTHSVACVVLTAILKGQDFLDLEGYELLKIFPGVETHDITVRLPVFDNAQDMVELGVKVEPVIRKTPEISAYLIRKHGLYGWGRTMAEAEHVIEAVETILECELKIRQFQN